MKGIFKKIVRTVDSEEKDIENIFQRLKNRDFSGNTGKVIKNSSYSLATILTTKIGALIFTILIARIMAPELYGLYGLALSTILLFSFFSDFGISETLFTFLSKTIDKDKKKAKGYFNYLTKYKLGLIFLSMLTLLIMARWLSFIYYSKPIYYALLAGGIYLFTSISITYFSIVFTSQNKFKPIFIKEVIFQVLRFAILPILTIFLLRNGVKTELFLFWIFMALSFCYLVTSAYLIISLKYSRPFNKERESKLTKKEKLKLKSFIIPLSVTAVSGVFFGYIDQVMLGAKVLGEFIGYYQVGFNLVTAAIAIISFSTVAIFPIFARLDKKRLNKAFRKARNLIFLIGITTMILTLIIAPYLVKFVYGSDYLPAVLYLRIFSLLLISFPLISIYNAYFVSQKITLEPSIILVASTVLNITLNYFLINWGFSYSMHYAVIGAATATIISRYTYLAGLIILRRIK